MPSAFLLSRGLQREAVLLAAGRNDEALELLRDRAGTPTAVAAAWAALREADIPGALLYAERACEQARDRTDGLMARALRAVAYANAGRPVERFDARDVVAADPLLLPEALLEIAEACTAARDLPGAHRWLDFAEPCDPHVLARHLLLRGRLAGMESRFREHAQFAAQALNRIEQSADDEAVLFRDAARMCASLAREIAIDDCPDFARIAQTRAADDSTCFEALRAQAWILSLHGAYDRAVAMLMQAALYIRSAKQHVAFCADLAAIAVMNGDAHSPFAQAALETAAASCTAERWEDAVLDDAIVVPQLLQTAAETQRERIAHALEERAQRILDRLSAAPERAAFSRYRALLHEAQAFAYADSDERAALRHAREAREAFEAFGYDWRAGRIASFIHQLTGLREWELRAKQHLRAYPASRIRRLLDAGGTARLTRRQQQVLDAVLHGKSLVQIAMHLRISEETVRKHLGPIMRHFGVKTRIELLSKLRRHSSDHDATFQKSDMIGSGENP